MRLVLALLAGLIAGCAPQLPRPFEHVEANPLLDLDDRAGLFLAADPLAPASLGPALVKALAKHEVALALDLAHPQSQRLGLRVVEEAEPGDRLALMLYWEIADREGLAIGHHDQPQRVSLKAWRAGEEALVKTIATEAAPKLADLLRVREDQPMAPPEAAKPRLVIEPIEGAPGDGARSLRLALSALLRQAGLVMVDASSDEEADFHLAGRVAIARDAKGAAKDAARLDLTWTLFDSSGAELGTVDQGAPIEAKKLDGAWGGLAYDIALGAAQGLVDLIGRSQAAAKP